MPRIKSNETGGSKARVLTRNRRKARLEKRRDFLRELERARTMTPQQRLETALDLINSLIELKEAARHAKDA